MIRVLIIGRTAGAWAERLGSAVGPAVEWDVARLPSAGIRQLEETPPDLVIIADEAGGPRVETLIAAIRNRPIGQLLALLLLCPQPSPAEVLEKIDSLELGGWLPADASIREVVREIEQTLDVVLGGESEASPKAESMFDGFAAPAESFPVDSRSEERSRETFPVRVSTSDYLLEPMGFDGGREDLRDSRDSRDAYSPFGEGEKPVSAALSTGSVERRSMFPSRTSSGFDGGLDSESVMRKLKDVRHEDYYAVLEIRRGAESQTVREAFYRLYARFDPQKVDFEVSHRYHAEFSEIRDALEDAWAVLGDPDLREPYLAHTVRK